MNISLFIFLFLFIAEVFVRVLGFSVDVPRYYVDKKGFYRYYPNQKGQYTNGNNWVINAQGNTGYEVDLNDSLITIIGDSFVEAFMNPPACHQSVLLKKLMPQQNFFSIARSGADFLEELWIANDAKSYTKTSKFVFVVNHTDFMSLDWGESEYSIDTNSNKISYPEFNQQKADTKYYLSKYFSFPYYIYRKQFANNSNPLEVSEKLSRPLSKESINRIETMLRYFFRNYDASNFVFVCKPDTDFSIYELLKKLEVKVTLLKAKNLKEWQHENDPHWTCFGHQEAALQIAEYLRSLN